MLASTVEYTVVFDVVQAGYRQWWFPAIGLIMIAVGIALIVFRHRLPTRGPRFFPFAVIGFAVLWTAFTFVGTFRDYLRLASDLRSGRCNVIEGTITDFDPKLKGESFRVGGQRFEYSDYIVTAGFNNMQSRGGPLRAGMPIRIHHVGNEIARLEVAR